MVSDWDSQSFIDKEEHSAISSLWKALKWRTVHISTRNLITKKNKKVSKNQPTMLNFFSKNKLKLFLYGYMLLFERKWLRNFQHQFFLTPKFPTPNSTFSKKLRIFQLRIFPKSLYYISLRVSNHPQTRIRFSVCVKLEF